MSPAASSTSSSTRGRNVRWAFVVLCALTLLPTALACKSGSDGPPATATPSPATATSRPSTTPQVAPTTGPSFAPISQPLIFTPVSPPESFKPPYLYDVLTGSNVSEAPAYESMMRSLQAWRWPVSRLGDGTPVVFDAASGRWLRPELTGRIANVVPGPDRSLVAINSLERGLALINLKARTIQEFNLDASPLSWSPDGTRLLIYMRRTVIDRGSPFFVLPVDNPGAMAQLPLGGISNPIGAAAPQWLSNASLLSVSQKQYLLQIFDLTSQSPSVLVEQLIPSDQFSISRDGKFVAVQRRAEFDPEGVAIYQLEPFALAGSLPSASLGHQLFVPSEVWSADSRRILGLIDFCKPSERLVSFNTPNGSITELASGGIFRFVFSPDGRWVAYTAETSGYIVPADGSSAPRRVAENVHAPVTPLWSVDSRYAVFPAFFGGYDRCV